MAMPGGQGGPMGGMQGQIPPQQQQMMHQHQQMVAQQQAQAAAAAAAAQAQQQMGMNPTGMSPGQMMGIPGGGPSPHPPGIMAQHPPMQQGPMGGMQMQLPHPGQQLGLPPGAQQGHMGQPMSGQGPPMQGQVQSMQGQGMGGPMPGQGPPMPGQGLPMGQPMPGQHPQQHQQPHPQPGHMPPNEQQRLDNISKAKSLVPAIKDALTNVMRTGANAIYTNNMIDSGSKPVDYDVTRFDRSLEEFFSLCDQMEVHLKTSMECISQGMSSARYLQTPITSSKSEGSMTYPHYLSVVRSQIAYAKEVHGTLADAAHKLSLLE